MLSIGGRVTLINSVISAIPLYWLGIYRMPKLVRMRIDKLRKRFLWQGGSSVKKKYALVSWKVVCKSKDQGGLGLLDPDLMNIALRAKWWIRFNDPNVQGI